MPKILFIGDIVGKGGRKVLLEVLPKWREKYLPDAVIVNVENMAHGKGVTVNTMESIKSLEIDCYTSGNHVFDKGDLSTECFEKYHNLIRPANYPSSLPGHGYYRFSKNGQQYLVINLSGQVFMEKQFDGGGVDNPFLTIDKLVSEQAQKGDIIVIDLHADATSEKMAFGNYVDGRAAAVLGTHTHVPTADSRILPQGTAYITDVGMTGPKDSIIGVKKENVLAKFLDPNSRFKNEVMEDGVMMINGVLVEVGDDGKAVQIQKLYQEI